MEFVRGVLMSDYLSMSATDPRRAAAWRAENNMRPALVARRLFHSFLRQVFEDNFFHSDLHPGNIVLLRDSRIAFLDFGSLGTMERDFGRKVDMYIEAMSRREYAKMVDIYFLFSDSLPDVDLSECKNHMVHLLQSWGTRTRVSGLPYRQKSFNVIQDEFVFFAARYGVSPVWAFFRMTRAMTTMDASLRELIPDAEVPALVAAYYRAARPPHGGSVGAGGALSSPPNLQEWAELPNRAMESTMFAVDIVRRHAAMVEGTTSHFAQFFARIFGNVARGIFVLVLGLLALALWQHLAARRPGRKRIEWRARCGPAAARRAGLAAVLGVLWFMSRPAAATQPAVGAARRRTAVGRYLTYPSAARNGFGTPRIGAFPMAQDATLTSRGHGRAMAVAVTSHRVFPANFPLFRDAHILPLAAAA